MPTYVYRCDACESEREVVHGANDPGPGACPECNAPVRRVFIAPRVNVGGCSSPTAARYAKMSAGEEVAFAQAEFDALRRSRRSEPPAE